MAKEGTFEFRTLLTHDEYVGIMNIEKRNIATCIVLSLVTCGIYQIVWVIKVAKEAVSVKDPQDNALAEILLKKKLEILKI